RALLLDKWNTVSDRPAAVDGPASVHEAVLRVCARTPDAVAVTDPDGGQLSYGELDRRSATLAAELIRLGVRDEDPVALLLPRSADLVVAMLPTLRAGSPYLPLDVEHPQPRLAAILADAAPSVVITSAEHAVMRILDGQTVLVQRPGGGDPSPLPSMDLP